MDNLRIWCVGNPLMGDDAVGCRIGELLNAQGLGVVDCGTTPENHLATLRKNPPQTLLIVDAADMNINAGAFRRMKLDEIETATVSSHGVPLSLLLAPFTAAMEITAIGIQPAALQMGAPLSPAVETAARQITKLILDNQWRNIEALEKEL